MLERTPESNGTQPGNSLGALFSSVKSLGNTLGLGKKEDYALLQIESNRLVPVSVSLEDKQVQVMSMCKQKNILIAKCQQMDTFDSAYEPDGSRHLSHYFWRINWFNVPGRPILVSQEGGLSKISATDLNSGKKVILFERTLGIANFNTVQHANGKISVHRPTGLFRRNPRRRAGPARQPAGCGSQDCRQLDQALRGFQSITSCCCSPRPGMPRRTWSPFFRKRGFGRPMPTPGGVPVAITSPGSRVMNVDR